MWVPELGGEVKSTDIVIDELATEELEQVEVYKNIDEKEKAAGDKRVYTVEEFEHLKGTVHTDNEDG